MKRISIVIALLLLAGCFSDTNSRYSSSFNVRNGQLLLDGIARECTGELTVVFRLSSDAEANEISATCVQEGPIEGSFIEVPKNED